jgi:hypothetical protein
MKTFHLVGLVLLVLVGSFALKAQGEIRQRHDRVDVPGLKAKISEAPFLDKTWTTGYAAKSSGSQVVTVMDLTSIVSFQAEGTGLFAHLAAR